jgi:hypothetical protein
MWMLLIPDRPNDWLIAATSLVAAASVSTSDTQQRQGSLDPLTSLNHEGRRRLMAGRAAHLEMQGLHRDEGSRHAGRIDAPGLNSQSYCVFVSGEVRICGKA